MEKKWPLVSVVIINWNAKQYIDECLKSVLNAEYPNLEIILVDNASTDGSIEHLRQVMAKDISKIKIIQNEKNYGAAYALNLGARNAKGEYLSFLASDTKVDHKYLKEIIKVMTAGFDIGACGSKLLSMNNCRRLDHAGEYLSQYGFLITRIAGHEIDEGQFDVIKEIFSMKGTGLTIRKEVFFRAGSYDEDYFMFLEETDLCWRIWLMGYRIVFVPHSIIYHASGISINSYPNYQYLVKFYGTRNYIYTLFKNLGTFNLFVILPIHILLWLGLAFLFLFLGRARESLYIIKGTFWAFTCGHSLFRKRIAVQKLRMIEDSSLMPMIMRKMTLKDLKNKALNW